MPKKRIIIEIPEKNSSAVASLLADKAPATCRAIWDLLAKPLEILGTHAMWTGPEISMQVAPERAGETLDKIPPENLTVFPQAGSLVWAHLPPHAFAGRPEPLYDIGLFYGPQGRIFLPMGWVPCNHFAQIEGDWSEFQTACRSLLTEGRRRLILRREE